jgi:hypothetical protein
MHVKRVKLQICKVTADVLTKLSVMTWSDFLAENMP